MYVDLLFASSGVEPEIASAAVLLDGMPVADIGHLIALKLLAESEKRLQSRIDL